MKRTPFKIKSPKPLKKCKIKRKSKSPQRKAEDKLWNLCKQIVRKRYPPVCYTCSQTGLSGANFQTGHVPWPKGALGAYLKYDLRVLRPQCFNCNINLGGMGAVAYEKMLKEIGPKEMAQLQMDRQIVLDGFNGRPKAIDYYQKLIVDYTQLLEKL